MTPDVARMEVANRCLLDGMTESETLAAIHDMEESCHVVPIDARLAVAAALATQELRRRACERRIPVPGYGDGLVLASARRWGTQVLTGDPHFGDLPET